MGGRGREAGKKGGMEARGGRTEEGAGRAGGRGGREAGGANGCHARMQNAFTSPGPDACMHVCMHLCINASMCLESSFPFPFHSLIFAQYLMVFSRSTAIIAFQFQVLTLSDPSPNACVYVSMCLQFLFHSLIPDGT